MYVYNVVGEHVVDDTSGDKRVHERVQKRVHERPPPIASDHRAYRDLVDVPAERASRSDLGGRAPLPRNGTFARSLSHNKVLLDGQHPLTASVNANTETMISTRVAIVLIVVPFAVVSMPIVNVPEIRGPCSVIVEVYFHLDRIMTV